MSVAGGRVDRSTDELRQQFEAARLDVEILERINAQLRLRNDDEANALQVEVASALIGLRGRKAASPPPVAIDPLHRILATRGMAEPTGEPLHRYRVTDEEWTAVTAWVRRAAQHGLFQASPRASAIFVLWASEWFRREHQGGHYKWDHLRAELGADLPYGLLTDLTRQGLHWWRRQPRIINGDEERILSLALEGGFPTRLLEARENGWLASHLRRSIVRLSSIADPDEEAALRAVIAGAAETPHSYRHGDFHEICAELILAVVRLKREAAATAPRGVAVVAWLDATQGDWRETLPLRLEGDGIRRLLEDLVSVSAETLGSAEARCRRLLVRKGSGWVPALELSSKGDIRLPPRLMQHDGRYRVHPAGHLADCLVGELALVEPPGDAGTWLSLPRGPSPRLIAPYPFDRAAEVEFSSGTTRWKELWPRGDAERGSVLIFASQTGDEGEEPDRLELIGSGSLRSRRLILYVLAPCDYVLSGDGASQCIWAGDGRRLVRVTGTACLTPPSEEFGYRVEANASSDKAERLLVTGDLARGLQTEDGPVVFAGAPQIRGRVGPTAKVVNHELVWRRSEERAWRRADQEPIGEGSIEVLWRDPQARAARDRQTFVILPKEARLHCRPQGDAAFVRLESGGDWSLAFDEQDIATPIARHGGWEVRFVRAPRRSLRVRLVHPRYVDIPLTCRYPISRGAFAKADGGLFRTSDAVVLDRLRGARAVVDGPAQLALELHGDPGSSQLVRFVDELPLWSISGDLRRLMGLGKDLDQQLILTLEPGGAELRVCRTEGEVLIDRVGGRVGFRDAGDEARAERRLEWRSIVDPGSTGERILGLRTWADDQYGKWMPIAEGLRGHGLVYARVDGIPRGRPTLLPGPPVDLTGMCALQRHAYRADQDDRRRGITDSLRSLKDGADGERGVRFLHDMLTAIDGLPPISLDVFRYLPWAPDAAALLLVTAATDAERERVWRLEQELPLTWLLVPVEAWRHAFAFQAHHLAGLLQDPSLAGQVELIVRSDQVTRSAEILRLEPALRAALAAAGVCEWPQEAPRTHKEIAQERVRRSVAERGDRASAPTGGEGTCFRDDPLFKSVPPEAFSHFDATHWEALEAPWAAALRAAGQVTLSRKQLFRVRAAMAEDPVHFTEAYVAFLTEFAGAC